MAITRSQLLKELEPGLNALFGLEYDRYDNEHAEIFDTESSDRAFEEEVMLSGFGQAPVKGEGAAVSYDTAGEAWTARYTHETIALAFAITEEAVEDNLYDRLSARYTRALARSMANTKQVKAAAILNNAFNSAYKGGDGVELCGTHATVGGGNVVNEPATPADLNETSLEQALIDISAFVDERGLKIALRGMKLIVPPALQFTAERILVSDLRVGTADNDVNAIMSTAGGLPEGYMVNDFLTSAYAWFLLTNIDGLSYMERVKFETDMQVDFVTDNLLVKGYERYSFGYYNWRSIYGSFPTH